MAASMFSVSSPYLKVPTYFKVKRMKKLTDKSWKHTAWRNIEENSKIKAFTAYDRMNLSMQLQIELN